MITNMLCLSTCHMPAENSVFGNIRSMETEFGYIVWPCIGIEDNEIESWFLPILKFAVENECTIIEFDADNETMTQFQTYGW